MPGLFEINGAAPKNPTHYTPLFIENFGQSGGLFTNRSALIDPSGVYEKRYLGGRPGSLIGGLNTEISVRNSMIRRYGHTPFSTFQYPTPPDRAFSFEDSTGTVRVLVDTAGFSLSLSGGVAAGGGNTAVYSGTFPGGVSNAYVGLTFDITGFTMPGNNGTFVCTASTTTTITVVNPKVGNELTPGTATVGGGFYYDQQNGSATLLFAKSPGAGQMCAVAVAGILYCGDGVETFIYYPNNANGTIWSWGVAAPLSAPKVAIIESGSAAVQWAASTFMSTMGLVYDSANSAVYQLQNVSQNSNTSVNFGETGNGQPAWNQTPGDTTSDNTITWTNRGPVGNGWQANSIYSNAAIGGTLTSPCCIFVNGNIFVNAAPGQASGKSGAQIPNFKTGIGAVTWDNQVKWFCIGSVATWQKSHLYAAYGAADDINSVVIEPTSLANGYPTNQTVYLQSSSGGTSGSGGTSPFSSTTDQSGTTTIDNQIQWLSLGSYSWTALAGVSAWSVNGATFSVVKDSNNNWQVCIQTGVVAQVEPGTSFTLSAASNASSGQTTYTGSFSPTIPVGNGSLSVVITGFTNAGNNGTFTVVSCSATHLVVNNSGGVAESHVATAQYNPWGTTYGAQTVDGSAIWTCVGSAAYSAWAANTTWELPVGGFSPPTSSNPYGGSVVEDSNANVEFCISSGLTGASAPTWSTALNQGSSSQTTDNQVTWYALEVYNQNSLSWTKGYIYAYSFKERSLTDYYSTADYYAPGANTATIPIPPGLTSALPAPTGSLTGGISTASPTATITGSNAGAVNTITGLGSTNPAVDTIVIWRTADGGSASQMYELTEIPAPPPIGGIAQPWTFEDYLPDIATSQFPGLDYEESAPIADVNDPPPSNLLPQDYNFLRIWGIVGQSVFFSGGPDTLVGNPQENWNPSDEFPFLSNCVRAIKMTTGLAVFTSGSVEIIMGGPLTASFYSVTLAPGIGLGNFNGLDIFAGEVFFMDTTSTVKVLSPNLSITDFGFPIADQLEKFNPKTVYLTFADLPNDRGLYIGTGSSTYNGSTGWFRCNPRQIPGGVNGPEPVWSPFAAISGGAQMVQAIEVSLGIKKLLVGSNTTNQVILERNTNVFTDNGTEYDANFQIGSLWLAHRGELALLKFVESDFAEVTTDPTMSYLLNEISGTFSPFVAEPQLDPPVIYGQMFEPSSYNPYRYFFASTGALAACVHMQVGVDFGTTSNADEIFNLTIYGAVVKGK